MATGVQTPVETSSSSTITQTTDETDHQPADQPVLRLRLRKPKTDKKVQWRTDTVDNEGMNKKKSKCCCIYVKPRQFGESSSESEDECENCFGHVELRKNRHNDDAGPSHDDDNDESNHHPANDTESNQ